MALVRAVIVILDNLTVDNVTRVATPLPQPAQGTQWIPEADWVAGQEPKIGDVWNGTIPASFTTPAPADPEDAPDNIPDAIAAVREAQQLVAERLAQLEALATGG